MKHHIYQTNIVIQKQVRNQNIPTLFIRDRSFVRYRNVPSRCCGRHLVQQRLRIWD
jgi:hypothetical protein